MIAITYLLTSKWHNVDDFALMVLGLIDMGIIAIIMINI